jgi:hypothetical protein
MSTFRNTNEPDTEKLRETIQRKLQYLTPEDGEAEQTDHHKRIRTLTEKTMKTADDKFTRKEIRQTKTYIKRTRRRFHKQNPVSLD